LVVESFTLKQRCCRLLLLLILPVTGLAQSIAFDQGKTFTLDQLKSQFRTHKVDVFNFYIRSFESYNAFYLNDLLDSAYGKGKWYKSLLFQVSGKDNYRQIVELNRLITEKAFLAYEKSDNTPFTTIGSYKDKIVDLAPFYLIWKENYKKGVLKIRNHWVWKVAGIKLIKGLPGNILPAKDGPAEIRLGFENYMNQCMACHSIDALGGEKGPEIFHSGLLKNYSDQKLRRLIKNPRKINPKAKMPKFSLKVKHRNKRINAVIKYLRYIQLKLAPAKKSK
jgi:cytochrome c2